MIFQSSVLVDDREQVFLLPHMKYVTFTALVKNCISVFCDHYHGNMQVYRDFLGGNLMLHI